MQMQPVDGEKWRGGEGGERGGERTAERESHRSCTQRWDAVAALRTMAAWDNLSLTTQVECKRGIQMTGTSDCHHLGEEDM